MPTSEVPWHVSGYSPAYKFTVPATRVSTLEHARELGKAAGLQFVYIGNVPGHPGDNTYCPGCGTIVIRRPGFAVLQNKLRPGLCPKCNVPVASVWKTASAM